MNFSYPGYNGLLTGVPDRRIDSNDKRLNPNVTVFEWLHHKPAYHGKVSAVGSWDRYPFIFNVERSGLYVNAGWVPFEGPLQSERQVLLNKLIAQRRGCGMTAATTPLPFSLRSSTSPSHSVCFLPRVGRHRRARSHRPVRQIPACPSRHRWQPQSALGRAAIAARVSGHDHADRHHRPRPGRPSDGLARSRRQDTRLRRDLDSRHRARHPRVGRANEHDPGHARTGSRDHRRVARRRLPGRGHDGGQANRRRDRAGGEAGRDAGRSTAAADRIRIVRHPGAPATHLGCRRGRTSRADTASG